MHASKLCLHCGANNVERDELAFVPTPERTRSWVPIPHERMLGTVLATLERTGLEVVTEAHGLTRDGQRYFGLLQVNAGDSGNDFGLVVGLRNSHDKSFPAGLAVGASVFVCDNLSFSGEVKLARKHTVFVERDLPQLIDIAIARMMDLRLSQERRFLSYKMAELDDRQAHDLLIQALDAQVLPVTKLPEVLQEWRAPRHPEFAIGKTGWRLFNAFTEALKGNLDQLPRRTQALHGLMDAACDIVDARQPQLTMAV